MDPNRLPPAALAAIAEMLGPAREMEDDDLPRHLAHVHLTSPNQKNTTAVDGKSCVPNKTPQPPAKTETPTERSGITSGITSGCCWGVSEVELSRCLNAAADLQLEGNALYAKGRLVEARAAYTKMPLYLNHIYDRRRSFLQSALLPLGVPLGPDEVLATVAELRYSGLLQSGLASFWIAERATEAKDRDENYRRALSFANSAVDNGAVPSSVVAHALVAQVSACLGDLDAAETALAAATASMADNLTSPVPEHVAAIQNAQSVVRQLREWTFKPEEPTPKSIRKLAWQWVSGGRAKQDGGRAKQDGGRAKQDCGWAPFVVDESPPVVDESPPAMDESTPVVDESTSLFHHRKFACARSAVLECAGRRVLVERGWWSQLLSALALTGHASAADALVSSIVLVDKVAVPHESQLHHPTVRTLVSMHQELHNYGYFGKLPAFSDNGHLLLELNKGDREMLLSFGRDSLNHGRPPADAEIQSWLTARFTSAIADFLHRTTTTGITVRTGMRSCSGDEALFTVADVIRCVCGCKDLLSDLRADKPRHCLVLLPHRTRNREARVFVKNQRVVALSQQLLAVSAASVSELCDRVETEVAQRWSFADFVVDAHFDDRGAACLVDLHPSGAWSNTDPALFDWIDDRTLLEPKVQTSPVVTVRAPKLSPPASPANALS